MIHLKTDIKIRYQNKRGSELVLDYVQFMYYKCHKINFNGDGSYIDYPDWVKNRKTTINPINKKDNKCFQFAVIDASNYEEIQKIHKE